MDGGQGDSIVLEEEIDPNYEPTEDEVLEYAKWLGMDLEAERDLFWIAREGLKAPLPENWKPCKTTDTGEIYYFNFATGASTWDHPCDEYYRKLYDDHKKKTIQGKKFQDTDDKKKKEKEDIAEILGKKSKKAPKKAPKVESLSAVKSNLDKKPLGALTKAPLGGGLGALKPVGGLGKSSSKAMHDDSGEEEEEEEEKTEAIKSLSTKKPLGKTKSGNDDYEAKAADLEAKLQRLEEEHAEKIAALNATLEQKQDELQVEQKAIEKKLQKLQKDHADEVENMKELEKKLAKRRKDLDTEHREYLDSAESKFAEKKRDLQRRQEKEIKDLEESHRATLRDMENEHERDLEKIEERKRKEEMQQEHRQKEESNKIDKLNSELESLKAEIGQYKRQIKTLEDKLRDEAEKTNESPELAAEIESLKTSVEDLQNQLKQKTNIISGQEETIQEQKNEIGRLKSVASAATNDNKLAETLEEQLQELKDKLKHENERAEELEKDCNQFKQTIQELSENEAQSQGRAKELEILLNEMTKKHDDTLAAQAKQVQELKEKLEIVSQVEETPPPSSSNSDVNEWKDKYSALESKHKTLETDFKATTNKYEELVQVNKSLDARLEDNSTKLKEVEKSHEAANEKLNESNKIIDKLQQSNSDLKNKIEDLTTNNANTIQKLELQITTLRSESMSWQSQYDQLLGNSNNDRGLKDMLTEWQHKYDELHNTHASSVADYSQQIESLEAKCKTIEREKTAQIESISKKLTNAQEEYDRQAAQAKTTINDLQSKLTFAKQSQEMSTNGLVASLQQQLDEAYKKAQESQDAQDESERKHRQMLELTTNQFKQQLEDQQNNHSVAMSSLKSELIAAESAKKKNEDQRTTLERKLKQKENEISTLTTQLQHQQKTSNESSQSMWEYEREKLKSQVRALEDEKLELESALEVLRKEHDALVETQHRATLEKDLQDKKLRGVESEKEQILQRFKGIERDLDALQTKARLLQSETTEQKTTINKLKLNLATAEAQQEKAVEECKGLEILVKQQRDLVDKYQVDSRQLQTQLDEALFQKQNVDQELSTCQHEVSRLKEQLTTRSSASKTLTSSSEDEFNLRQQVDQLTSDVRAANEKARQWQVKAQDFETKFKQSQEAYDRQTSSWNNDKQAAADKLEKLRSQHQQLDRNWRSLVQEKEELSSENERLENDKLELERRVRQLQETISEAQSKSTGYIHQLDDIEAQKRSLAYDMQTLENKFKRTEQELERIKSELSLRTQEKDSIEMKWRADVAQFESKIKSLRQDQTDQWNKRAVDEESKREDINSQWKKEMEEKKKEWQTKVNQLEADKAGLQNQVNQLSKDLAIAQKDVEHLGSMKQKQESTLKSLSDQTDRDRQQLQEELDQVKSKLKAITAEKDELLISLSSSQNHFLHTQSSAPPIPTVSEAFDMNASQIKLQMAQANKTELETHLQDLTLQCEALRRKSTVLECRSRDQALEMEALHVENAALRSSAQRMHLSIVESLSTVERLNYEHKKRILRAEYMAQLREFTEREEVALARQKARVRASCERQIEELVDEFEKHKQRRMDEEERNFQATMSHCHNEFHVKLSQLQKDHRDTIAAMEQDLHSKQQKKMEQLTKQMHEEEEQLSARLRDTKQLNREDDLAKVNRLQPGIFEEIRWNDLKETVPLKSPVKSPARSPSKTKKKKNRHVATDTNKLMWKKRIHQENELLQKAKYFLSKQKKILKQRLSKLQDEKDWWLRQPSASYSHSSRRDMKHLLEQHAELLANDAKELKTTEKWVARREDKIKQMESACKNDEWCDLLDEGEDSPSESSMDGQLEQLHEQLLHEGSKMSAFLQNHGRSQEAASVLPWPSEIQDFRPMETRQVEFIPPAYQMHYKGIGDSRPWAYQRPLQERMSTYEPYRPTPAYDAKLSQFVHKREPVSNASTRRNYLDQLSKELREYSRKYKSTHSEGEIEALP